MIDLGIEGALASWRRDPYEAASLLDALVRTASPAVAWPALAELAIHHQCMGNAWLAARMFAAIVDEPTGAVDRATRTIALVRQQAIAEAHDRPIDRARVENGIRGALLGRDGLHAGLGYALLGRLQLRDGDRPAAKATFWISAHCYLTSAAAINLAANGLRRLAEMELDDGNAERARDLVELALHRAAGSATRRLAQLAHLLVAVSTAR